MGLQYSCELVQTVNDGASINCDFIRISIEPPNESEMAKGWDELLKELENMNPQEFKQESKKLVSGMRDSFGCSELQNLDPIELVAQETGRPNERGVQIMRQLFSELQRFYCQENELTKDDVARFMKAYAPMENSTCKLSIFEYSESFKLTDENTWASNTGPIGPCGLIEIFSFSKVESQLNLPFWDYSERTLRTKQEDEYCKDLSTGELVEYGWVPKIKAVPESCIWLRID